MNNRKGLAPAVIILIIVGVLAAASIGAIYYHKIQKENQPKACTMEAKLCPDGSSVGRTGSNCEFAECPEIKPDETTGWQTYRNEEYGFEIKFPKDWYWKHFGKIDERNLDISEIGRNIVSNLGDGDISITVESLLLKNGFTSKSVEIEHELPNFQSKIITVNGKTAIEYTARTNKDIKGIVILSNPESKIVYNITTKGEENFIFFDQILSTFKFIQ